MATFEVPCKSTPSPPRHLLVTHLLFAHLLFQHLPLLRYLARLCSQLLLLLFISVLLLHCPLCPCPIPLSHAESPFTVFFSFGFPRHLCLSPLTAFALARIVRSTWALAATRRVSAAVFRIGIRGILGKWFGLLNGTMGVMLASKPSNPSM